MVRFLSLLPEKYALKSWNIIGYRGVNFIAMPCVERQCSGVQGIESNLGTSQAIRLFFDCNNQPSAKPLIPESGGNP